MAYSLRRTRDGAGDSGLMSMALWEDENSESSVAMEDNAKPRVGVVMRVGSHYGRTYSSQDWWQTTYITEILEERTEEDGTEYIRFKTGNSEYEWTHQ
jgi:hypothetical protein